MNIQNLKHIIMADENMTEGSMSDDDVEIVPSAHNEQPVEVRTTEDILEYLQKKNPRIMPFMHKGRMCVKFQDFYMTVCNVKVGAAKMAKNRLIAKNPELCSRIIESLDAASESHELILLRSLRSHCCVTSINLDFFDCLITKPWHRRTPSTYHLPGRRHRASPHHEVRPPGVYDKDGRKGHRRDLGWYLRDAGQGPEAPRRSAA